MKLKFDDFVLEYVKHVLSVSLAPPKAPLKLSLLHSIVFHMLLIKTINIYEYGVVR